MIIDSTVINSGCSNGDLRLTDGSTKYEGRVEICTNGVWGSICDSGWGDKEAYAVCKQLQLGFRGNHVFCWNSSFANSY